MEARLEEGTISCSLCAKQFLTQSLLETHLESHLEDHLYKCDHCGLGFSQYVSLENHMSIHTTDLDRAHMSIHTVGLDRAHMNIHTAALDRAHMNSLHSFQTPTEALYNLGADKVLYHCALCSKEYYAGSEHINVHGPSYSGDQTHLCVDCRSRGQQQHFSTLDPPVTHIDTLRNIAPLMMPSSTPVLPLLDVASELLMPVSLPQKDDEIQKGRQLSVSDSMNTCNQVQVDNDHSFLNDFEQRRGPSRPCRICRKSFHTSYVKIHEKLHSDDRPYACNLCDKKFKAKQTFERHLFFHTDQRPFPCHLCKSSFKVRHQLRVHLRSHEKSRLEKDKELVSRTGRSRQKKIILGVKCPDCSKRFLTDLEYQDHITECSKNRPFMCCECGRKFITQTNLYNHRKTHTELKPHQCVQCGKFFRQINALKRHRILHTSDKPYWCVICTAAEYQTYKALKTHMIACRKEKGINSTEEGVAS